MQPSGFLARSKARGACSMEKRWVTRSSTATRSAASRAMALLGSGFLRERRARGDPVGAGEAGGAERAAEAHGELSHGAQADDEERLAGLETPAAERLDDRRERFGEARFDVGEDRGDPQRI